MARILVADDDPVNLKVAVTALASAGHDLLQATDGATALEIARVARPDLCLLDVQMPGMDGASVLRELRADDRTRHVHVIALTALAMKGDEERLLALGFDGYIAKPIRYRTFVAAVAAALAPPAE